MRRRGRRPAVSPVVAGFAAGMAIAVVVGLMATINFSYGAPWGAQHTLTAAMSDTDAMAVGSDVRIAGRLVGQVTAVTAHGDHSDVSFHIDGSDWPLPSDTIASVRLATLLGQKYIQLNPGHASQMLKDGGTIPLQATKPVVDFDQILNTFDAPTRKSLTTLLTTLSGAVQDQEGTLQQLAPALSDLSVHSQVPTQELASRDPEVNAILVNLGVTAAQLDQSRNDLASVIDNLNQVTATLASNSGSALKSFISNADTIQQTTNDVLGGGRAAQLGASLNELGTFTTDLTQLVTDTLPQTRSFMQPVGGSSPAAPPATNIPQENLSPAQSGLNLMYEIADATSQADAPGNFFLRQNVQGLDIGGLLRPGGVTNPAAIASGPTGPSLPSLPSLPTLPTLPLPTLPTPSSPSTPCLPLLQNCSGSSGGGTSGGSQSAPTPTPAPTPCALIVCLSSYASNDASVVDVAVPSGATFLVSWW
jgi:phospholipid/cholesterol/gamma-HCH transport system substrate-binding protein